MAGYHIVAGSYGTNIKLDGLNMALMASWPGPIHEGHGKASFQSEKHSKRRQKKTYKK